MDVSYSVAQNTVTCCTMSGTGATGKVKSERSKSIWDVDYAKMEERIEARSERIRKRRDASKMLTKLMKIQKMMGLKGKEKEEHFVEMLHSRP